MPDLEKVIKGLDSCSNFGDCRKCPYDPLPAPKCYQMCELDALELLKKQEPIKPIRNLEIIRCGNCNCEIDRYEGVKYCPNCGRKVKWE